MNPIYVDVPAGSRRYPVYIEEGLTAHLGQLVEAAGLASRPLLVSSPAVWRLHGREIGRALRPAEPILVPDGERFKQLSTVSRIHEALIRAQADRGSTIVAVGGGVIGDMAGFAAATFLRGIGLVHVPTTLLAQVDSAIGGKVGVNHPLGKNLIGAFHQPVFVAIDPGFLGTLPRREFRAGLYEVIKYGMTSSRGLFERLGRDMSAAFAREPSVLVPLISEACAIKAAVVSQDEREAGPRRVLNFGHTAGHAIEAVTRYRRFRHGEAIAYGMLVAAEVAATRGVLAADDHQALSRMIVQLGPLPPVGDLSVREVLEASRRDKKIVSGKLHFVLATAVGAWTIVDDVTEKEMGRALKKLGLKPH
jgi:3-dehydroquinate synthase